MTKAVKIDALINKAITMYKKPRAKEMSLSPKKWKRSISVPTKKDILNTHIGSFSNCAKRYSALDILSIVIVLKMCP